MAQPQELDFLSALLPLVVIVFIVAMGVVLLNQHFRKNLYRQMLEKEALERKYHYELLSSSIEAQEQERKRIAHDLHDEIGALLSTSRMYFNQIDNAKTEDHLKQVTGKMNFLFDEMMVNIRRISHDLSPVVLENLGLVQAIESLGEKILKSGMGFSFTHHFSFYFSAKAELIVYRIVQELLGNTLKHSGAKNIFIEMKEKQGHFYFTYSDDGNGFLKSDVKHGLGIRGIESRLKLVDGRLDVWSDAGKGVQFSVVAEVSKLTKDE